jgi:hypothetical protein
MTTGLVGPDVPACVVIHTFGGLGNQLFQYAAGLGVANGLACSSLRVAKSAQVWPAGHPQVEDVIPGVSVIHERRMALLLKALRGVPLEAPFIRLGTARDALARAAGYQRLGAATAFSGASDSVQATRHPIFVDGYFQHPDWFRGSIEQVCSSMLEVAPDRLAELGVSFGANRAAVCYRRGDYVRLGWQLKDCYYLSAADLLRSRGISNITIVCEDEDFLAEQERRWARLGFMVQRSGLSSGSPALDDFWTIVACQHSVMANSTFAWWANVIGDRFHRLIDRLVTVPDPWLPNVKFPCMVPEWHTIPGCSSHADRERGICS